MRLLRRNWRIMLTVFGLVVCGGLWWGLGGHHEAAADPGPPGYEALSEAQRTAILNTMNEMGLDYDALVALNLSAEQAETLVAAGRLWWLQNHETLETLRATIATRTQAVRTLRAAIRQGPAQPGQDESLATALASLRTAREAYQTALDPLRSQVRLAMSDSQRSAWDSLDRESGWSMPLRLVDLSTGQRVALGQAWRTYRLNYAAADTPAERDAAVTAWETRRDTILTGAQQDVVDAYLGYWVASSEAVGQALDLVLPVEEA